MLTKLYMMVDHGDKFNGVINSLDNFTDIHFEDVSITKDELNRFFEVNDIKLLKEKLETTEDKATAMYDFLGECVDIEDEDAMFIQLLKDVESGEFPITTSIGTDEDDYSDENTDTHYCAPIIGKTFINSQYLSELAAGYLIDNVGKPNYKHIKILSDLGFQVSPGESDCFGWLTGLIWTKKGLITFG